MARQLLAVFLHGLPSEPGCTIIAAVARRLARRNTSYLGERALHNNIFNFDMKGPYFTKIWVHSCPQSYLDTSQGAYRCPCTSVTLDRFVLTTTHYNSPQLTSAVAGHKPFLYVHDAYTLAISGFWMCNFPIPLYTKRYLYVSIPRKRVSIVY